MPRKSVKRSVPPSSILLPTPNNLNSRRLKRYRGDKEKIVVAIDIGTTFSAVSFCILYPGCLNPQLETVSSWPGQYQSDPKVPSVLLHDADGNVMAWGAQTTHQDMKADAEQNGWERVQWFKLDMRPPHLEALIWDSTPGTPSEEPKAKTSLPVKNVDKALAAYTTFLQLAFEHLKSHFCKHHGEGTQLWDRLFPVLEVVFTIPNGWEFKQHNLIRQAAIVAGLMGRDVIPGRQAAWDRIRFVSEAEAAMVYAADCGNLDSWLQVGRDVILCDAGGGTIDITVYTVVKTYPLELKEKMAPKCVIAGAIFVNEAAERYLRNQLQGTKWDTSGFIDDLMDEFERDIKKRFENESIEYGIGRFDPPSHNDLANIRNGRLYIPGRDIVTFFEYTLNAIETNVLDVYERSGRTAENVIMVGGFMNSAYAYAKVEEWGRRHNLRFTKPDGVMAKAVSQGALLCYLSNPVQGHIAKFHYGSDVSTPAEDVREDTYGRKTVLRADGEAIFENLWQSIASMGQELPRKGAVRSFEKLVAEYDPEDELMLEEKIYIHRSEQIPRFMVDRFTALVLPEFEHVCTIVVDLRDQYNMMPWKKSKVNGKRFKTLEFDITVTHDGYELQAFSSWKFSKSKYMGKAMVIQPPQ